MGINRETYVKKPIHVEAVRVTEENFDEVAAWCQGEMKVDDPEGRNKKYIRVFVHNPKGARQTKAFVGDWVLWHEKGFKIYTPNAFDQSFDKVEEKDQNEYTSRTILAYKVGDTVFDPDEVEILTETRQLEELDFKSVDVVAEEPSQDTGVQPIQEIKDGFTPQGEPHEIVEATPEAIRDVVNEQQPIEEKPQVAGSEETGDPADDGLDPGESYYEPPETAQQGVTPPVDPSKRVLSEEEQRAMDPAELRELIRSNEVVLAQELDAA